MEGIDQKNYYELLGVRREATVDEIKDAYRDIARVFHPDSNFFDELGDVIPEMDAGGNQVFKVVTAAYNTLVNPDKRREYDRHLPNVRPWEDVEDLLRGGELDWRKASEADLKQVKRPRKPSGCYAQGKFGVIPEEPVSSPVHVNPARTTKVHEIIKEKQKISGKQYYTKLSLVMGATFVVVLGGFFLF